MFFRSTLNAKQPDITKTFPIEENRPQQSIKQVILQSQPQPQPQPQPATSTNNLLLLQSNATRNRDNLDRNVGVNQPYESGNQFNASYHNEIRSSNNSITTSHKIVS
jgi:hypothetical protein